MILNNKNIWIIDSNQNQNINQNEIIFNEFIKTKKNKNEFIKKHFILTKNKLFYMKNNEITKYIDLEINKIKFDKNELSINFFNDYNYFQLFFDNLMKFLNWKKILSKLGILSDFDKNYQLEKLIGQGLNSKIFKAVNIKNKKIYAVKYLSKDNNNLIEIKNEIKIMRTLKNNRNIINLKETYENKNSIFIVMEYSNFGNLKDILDQKYTFNINKLIFEILNGLNIIHSKNIIHRDIKPENIFLHKNADGSISSKIGDFGVSYFKNEIPLTKKVGTLGYFPPELLNFKKSQNFNFKSEIDIYSLGGLWNYIYSKNLWFNFIDLNDLKYNNKKNFYCLDNEIYKINKPLKKIIKQCIKTNPIERIKLIELIKFFN